MKRKVVVVGSGIIGLSTALALASQEPEVEVTVITYQRSPYTTGDGSAGFFMPYLLGKEISPERLQTWCDQSFDYLLKLYKSPLAADIGIGLWSVYMLSDSVEDIPRYAKTFINYREITQTEIQRFGVDAKYGAFTTTLYTECLKFLPYLEGEFLKRGGTIIVRRVECLDELAEEYDLVVNCTGIGSSALTRDSDLKPIRGQVIRVQAPWIKHGIVYRDFYVLLNTDVVILGGTKQIDWKTSVDPKDSTAIVEGCSRLVESVTTAPKVCEWVGLRPGRDSPRIEREVRTSNGKTYEVIHNYGHGGSGVTIFWGCAQEVVLLVQDWLQEQKAVKLTSRL